MKVDEIKAAVDAGRIVCWNHDGYQVIKDKLGQYFISYLPTGHLIGLTWRDGKTLNGDEDEFFIKEGLA
jgi:hypothetical protein